MSTARWVVDRDCFLVGVHGDVDAVISSNPALTLANWFAPSNDEQLEEFVVQLGQDYPLPQLKIPLSKGREIFVESNNVFPAVVQLFLEDVVN